MPQDSAISTPSTDAQTEVAPLIPHRNAVGASGRRDASFMPIGNGIPISRPRGTRKAMAVRMRTGVVWESSRSMARGVVNPKAMRSPTRARRGQRVNHRGGGVTLWPLLALVGLLIARSEEH